MEEKTNAEKIIEHYNKNEGKRKKMIAYFKTLEEGVDYKKVPSCPDAPLEVFQLFPISEKGGKYFTGEY